MCSSINTKHSKDSFSFPHTLAYSLIAMLELNLNLHYNPIYWQTAVLNSNAGTIELGDDIEKQQNKDYGKVAKAVSELQEQGVKVEAPLINTAGYSFSPDVEGNRIIFSLKAIVGLNEEAVKEIIEKRPYTSFEDFYQRVYKEGNNLKPSAFVSLIKSGAFTEFEEVEISMTTFIFREIKPKEKLNGQNMKSIVRLGLLSNEKYKKYLLAFNMREQLHKQKYKSVKSPKDTLLFITVPQMNLFGEVYGTELIKEYDNQGRGIISKKELKTKYDEIMSPFFEEANTKEFLMNYNKALFFEEWNKRTKGGDRSKWAMDSLVYYPNEHELDRVDLESYGIKNFNELDPNPMPIGYSEWNGRQFPQYKIETIAGTVIDKNNNKHTFTLLTPSGVAICKMYTGAYAHYNKEIKKGNVKIEDSWFKRGTLLLVNGYRREEQFVVKKPSKHLRSINLIEGITSNNILILKERE